MEILFFLIYGLSGLWAIISILLYGNRPGRSIGWLFVVVTLPIAGVLLYMLFGINRKRFKFFTLNHVSKRRLYDLNHTSENINEFKHKFDSQKFSKIGKLLGPSTGFPAVDGNKISVLKTGDETFNEIFKAIENAEHFIHLQYYILSEGEILDKLCTLFKEKINHGVEVRILYDAIGSHGWKTDVIKKLKKLGVHIFPILPINIKTIISTLNYRNHRKIAVIDGTLAFTGGVNISDKYVNEDKSEFGIWDDMHLKLEGSIVDHLHRVFIKDYFFASNDKLLANKKYLPKQSHSGKSLVQIVTGGPDLDYLSIMHQYVMMIHCAEKSVYIENPYFIPNQMLLEALKMAALRDVEVTIMVPKNNDSKIAKYSMLSNFETLLKAGVNICMLRDAFSHSKLIIVDDAIASVGSGNFDYRSFEHNYEINTLIYDQAIAKDLANDFRDTSGNSETLDYETFRKRPVTEKLLQGLAKVFSPLL